MIDVQSHENKMNEIKQHIRNSKGRQKLQYIKCLHRLEKELMAYMNLKYGVVMRKGKYERF